MLFTSSQKEILSELLKEIGELLLCDNSLPRDTQTHQKPELDFTTIPAQVLPEDTSEKEVMKSKLIWQTGKSRWGRFTTSQQQYIVCAISF